MSQTAQAKEEALPRTDIEALELHYLAFNQRKGNWYHQIAFGGITSLFQVVILKVIIMYSQLGTLKTDDKVLYVFHKV